MTIDRRPMLIGMNNPVSSEPRHALFPHPVGCTGYRIYQMLRSRVPDATRRQYLDRFERRNLVPYKEFSASVARERAAEIERELWGSGRTVILFGADVAHAFGHPRSLLHPQIIGGTVWRQLPHPSGRNLWYNDEKNRFLVASVLEDLFNVENV